VGEDDQLRNAERLAERSLNYRIFPDAHGKMNRSLIDTGGAMLAVPQFTLVADSGKGNRPSFGHCADPELGLELFQHYVRSAQKSITRLETGEFGADMSVSLINTGPVTFWLSA
ncbi:MAG: D-aminoacyl-tRNA deacylase, partial [Pseudomonadota bacterium]